MYFEYIHKLLSVDEIMQSRKFSQQLKRTVKGLMIESFLMEGSQSESGNEIGKSITDLCLG